MITNLDGQNVVLQPGLLDPFRDTNENEEESHIEDDMGVEDEIDELGVFVAPRLPGIIP